MMPRLIRALSVCAVLFVLTAELAAQDKLKETPYYPLQVGTGWHYRSGNGKFTVRVAKHEKVGDTLCALLETTRDGKVVSSEHLAVTADGVFRHDLTTRQPQDDPNNKGKRVERTITLTFKPPMLLLKLPPKKGDSWKVDSTSDGRRLRGNFGVDEQEISVAAGKYKTFRVRTQELEVNGLKAAIATYFAEGVGMVKQEIEIGEARAEIQLEKFEAGGK